MDTVSTNYTGSATAIAALVVTVVSRFFPDLNITSQEILAVIFGVMALVGIIKQMVDHSNVVKAANVAGAMRSQ